MYPIIVLSITGLITLFIGFSTKSKQILLPVTVLFLFVAFALNLIDWNAPGLYFNDMVKVDNFNLVICSILIVSAILIIALTNSFKNFENAQPAEYYAIMQFSIVGAIMMVTFQNIIMLFLGLEILSVSMYVLTGSDKRNIRGNEAAIKYFLMGAFATGIFLFGVAMLYGAGGTFDISQISGYANQTVNTSLFFYLGMTFLLIGLLFKVSAAPFHWWTADVYEGAPTIFTLFMSTIVKTAGFMAIYKMLSIPFSSEKEFLQMLLIIMILASLIFGNLGALKQLNFKRMLAFSSVSHAGYMLLALLGMTALTSSGLAFYAVAYNLATITAFGVLMIVSKEEYLNGRPNENLSIFNGLLKRNSFLGVTLIIAMLSLTGIPLTAGFMGKFFVFQEASGIIWMLVAAVVASAIGLLYYFKPILAVLKRSDNETPIEVNPLHKFILIITTFGTVLLGIAPDVLRNIF